MDLKSFLLRSKSDFFLQEKEILEGKREDLISYLKMWGLSDLKIEYYLEAFDYFVLKPSDYDGSTASQDLYCIKKLESQSTLHDYDYVAKNCSGSLYYTRQADRILLSEMRSRGKCGAEITKRKILLWVKSYIFLYHLISKRKMSPEDITYMNLKIKIFLN